MVKDETVLVFQNANRNAEFHRALCLAFRDPARVRLEDRERLLVLWEHFPSQQPAVDLVDLAYGMREVTLDRLDVPGIGALRDQNPKRRLGTLHELPAAREIFLHPLRAGTADRPDHVKQPAHRPHQVLPLAPASNIMLRRCTPRLADQATHRVPQQTDIRGVVHIGLNHERVTPPAQGRARLFFLRPHGRSPRSVG